ncbi:glycine/D-amino acid oxidase-like deaminating enzyme [Trinickia symbiotica]|uniref:FAD-binding oxidoreductase n=1 Tax=Trinickia symbiotica TaxID=863227 RepID=A0A2N7X0K5_9BURK|nr:FAD-dependent oxidoreductase [Trinickia symbiotica]PMS35273.1 FAD-binding oxidoreductase [Trinickia symbiotica]PPK43839.1 glycine/D-amino acid oxidase-like deaminating enzyme [Trinickia symbiotica]
MTTVEPDVIVIGGGLVGMAISYGLAGNGARVAVLDEGDDAFRASRGNFGLVWVQGKGYGLPEYARWTMSSARLWPRLAAALKKESGVDVELEQPGGFHFVHSQSEAIERETRLAWLRDRLDEPYPFEMLGHDALKARLPAIGPEVYGASYTPMDGHVNPLKLLRALYGACEARGVQWYRNQHVDDVEATGSAFVVRGAGRSWKAPKVVLAAGLGNARLAPSLGLHAPVRPNRGQVLVGERVAPFLDYPTTYVRQTDEGTIQLGDSMEDVGFDDTTTTSVLATIARRGIRSFPVLEGLRLVRAWSALRVMSPDGFPIYQESSTYRGAFVATCHSGVTLAAAHALRLAPWIAGAEAPEEIDVFAGDRFLHSEWTTHHAH